MRDFNWKILYGFTSKELIWVRVAGVKYGVAIKRTRLTFSERNGHTRYLRLPFGWRLEVLRAKGA